MFSSYFLFLFIAWLISPMLIVGAEPETDVRALIGSHNSSSHGVLRSTKIVPGTNDLEESKSSKVTFSDNSSVEYSKSIPTDLITDNSVMHENNTSSVTSSFSILNTSSDCIDCSRLSKSSMSSRTQSLVSMGVRESTSTDITSHHQNTGADTKSSARITFQQREEKYGQRATQKSEQDPVPPNLATLGLVDRMFPHSNNFKSQQRRSLPTYHRHLDQNLPLSSKSKSSKSKSSKSKRSEEHTSEL